MSGAPFVVMGDNINLPEMNAASLTRDVIHVQTPTHKKLL